MTPTQKLRFVERKIYYDEMEESSQTVRILQQWWEGEKWNEEFTQLLGGEWRDIPLEQET
jgi:hypothetical protein